jgi:hypothetical protein
MVSPSEPVFAYVCGNIDGNRRLEQACASSGATLLPKRCDIMERIGRTTLYSELRALTERAIARSSVTPGVVVPREMIESARQSLAIEGYDLDEPLFISKVKELANARRR